MQSLEGNSLALVRADWMKRALCSRRTFKEMNRTQRAAADSTQLNYVCHIPAMSNPLLRGENKVEKKRRERVNRHKAIKSRRDGDKILHRDIFYVPEEFLFFLGMTKLQRQ